MSSSTPPLDKNHGAGEGSRPSSPVAPDGPREAWYHADFCHAYAWVYEDGDQLRVRWGERTGTDLILHSRSDCDRCREIGKDDHAARHGEFTVPKPSEDFDSRETFVYVLVEIAKYVPGLIEEDGDGD